MRVKKGRAPAHRTRAGCVGSLPHGTARLRVPVAISKNAVAGENAAQLKCVPKKGFIFYSGSCGLVVVAALKDCTVFMPAAGSAAPYGGTGTGAELPLCVPVLLPPPPPH